MAPFKLSRERIAIRDLPANSILVHATNGLGSWGAGFAADLKEVFPAAFERYREFCEAGKEDPRRDRWPARDNVVGTCLLVPPQPGDVEAGAPEVWIACVCTSFGYGRGDAKSGKPGKDGADVIVDQTWVALGDLRRQLDMLSTSRGQTEAEATGGGAREGGNGKEKARDEGGSGLGVLQTRTIPSSVIYSNRFNSGYFKVKWHRTEHVIKERFEGWEGTWTVMEQPE